MMATAAERVHESTISAGRAHWTALIDYLDQLSPWLVVAAYAVVYTMTLATAALATLALGAALSGMLGVAVFFTGGVGLIAAAPAVAKAMFERVLDAHEGR